MLELHEVDGHDFIFYSNLVACNKYTLCASRCRGLPTWSVTRLEKEQVDTYTIDSDSHCR